MRSTVSRILDRVVTEAKLNRYFSTLTGMSWRDLCNRSDHLRKGYDGVSRYVIGQDSSYLSAAKNDPKIGARILRSTLEEFPVRLDSSNSFAHTANVSPIISVVIPFSGRNRLSQLESVLASFESQLSCDFEVVLVCGENLVRNWGCYPHVRTLSFDEPQGKSFNKSRLFNLGVSLCLSNYLVLHDADIVVPRNYLSTCLSIFQYSWESFLPIRFLFYLTESQTKRFQAAGNLDWIDSMAEIRQNFAGGSVAITKQAFERISGFDEEFHGWGGEDVEFLHRLRKTNFLKGSLTNGVHLWHPPAEGKSQLHANLTIAETKMRSK